MATSLLNCSDDKDKGDNNATITYSVYQKTLDAGYYCVCWNQRTKSGQLVAAGAYQLHFQAQSYDTLLLFDILGTQPAVAAPECCDTATVGCQKRAGGIPDRFSVLLNSEHYSPGDSILIDLGIPVTAEVRIEVETR